MLFLLLAVPVAGMAQQVRKAIYLKDGSIIKGVIIEQVPGKSLKIQRMDGSILAYDMSEVEKIDKETSFTSRSRSGGTEAKPAQYGYRGFFDVGYTCGTSSWDGTDRLEFNTTHGVQFSPYFFFGIGMGVHRFYDSGFTEIPVFWDFRADIVNYKISPFVDFKVGYTVYDRQGLYLAPTVGCRFGVAGRVGLNIGIGYTVQKCHYDDRIPLSKENLGGFHVKLGVDF